MFNIYISNIVISPQQHHLNIACSYRNIVNSLVAIVKMLLIQTCSTTTTCGTCIHFPFILFPKLFNWMTDFVLYHDFSLKTMLHILRVALTIHLEKVDPKTIYSMCNPGTGMILVFI